MEEFGMLFIAVLLGIAAAVLSESSGLAQNQQCPVADEISRQQLEATIRQLMESLQKQGISEEDLLNRVERGADGSDVDQSYEEKFIDTCGAGTLRRCPREFKPIEGHICDNVEPIEPRGPFCNCPYCTGKEESRKEVRETDFEENEAVKSESAKYRLGTSVYEEKWVTKGQSSAVAEEKQFKRDNVDRTSEELPRRNLFSCQRSEPIYEAEKMPISGDPDFQEQLKSMTEEEQQPSLGILKFHEKRSREEGEL